MAKRGRPEWLRLVVVFYHTGLLALEVDSRRAINSDLFFKIGGDFGTVSLGGVFASKDVVLMFHG